MSRFKRYWQALTGQSGGREYEPGHEPEEETEERGGVEKQKKREQQQKQEVDRRATLPPQLQRRIKESDAAPKPYDAGLLHEVASHPVVQAYIDTMAQDAATAPWAIEQRDEKIEVEDERLAEAERKLKSLHPENTFRDLREMAARNTLSLGDGAWVLHFYTDGELAEAIPVDSQRLYKQVDEHGITRGYAEVNFSRRDITNRYGLEEVVWFEWASRTGNVYGHGPVEKGLSSIEVLEELSDKELKDLTEGMPPGIVSVKEDEDTPMAVDAYENVKDNWALKEGERHRAIVSMGDWDFTPLSPGYQELQFLERNKFWIHVLGAVFKVNAPYAGFDFQEGNKAQNQAQAEAYAQRGFRVLLRQMEEAINRQLLWPHVSEDLKFAFEREQTAAERQEQAQYLQELGDAAEQWVNLGREVTFRDGTIEIEDGEVEEPEDSGAGGGMGEIFGNADAAKLAKARKADDLLLQAYEEQIMPADMASIQKRTWTGDDSVPQYVVDQITEAINRGGAVFSDIQSVPQDAVNKLEGLLQDNLTQPQGWSLESVVDDMKDAWPGVNEEDLEVVARTETASVLNEAREIGYEDMPGAADATFYWQGPDDSRTTEACEELKDRTNPQHGGDPVPLDELVRMQEEVQAKYFDHLSFRKHTIHPNERHTFVRASQGAPEAESEL